MADRRTSTNRTARWEPYARRAGRNQERDGFREPWITLNVGWREEEVFEMLSLSPLLQHLWEYPLQREVFIANQFSRKRSMKLTFDHLHAALVQSRGDVINDIKCARCRKPKQAVFDQCISMQGDTTGACAADIWSGTASECAYNRDFGMAMTDINAGTPRQRGLRVASANQRILEEHILRHGSRALAIHRIRNPTVIRRPSPPANHGFHAPDNDPVVNNNHATANVQPDQAGGPRRPVVIDLTNED